MDPISVAATITGSAIAKLAFEEFIKSAAGESAKRMTSATLDKLKQLRHLIWNQLRGNDKAQASLTAAETGETAQVEAVGDYLQIAMREDPTFADKIRLLAHEITLELNQDNSSMVQNNSGNAKGWQTKVEGGTAYVGEIHIHGKES